MTWSATLFRSSLLMSAVIALGLLAGCAKSSQPYSSTIKLDGSQEVPPVTTSAKGTGEITVLPNRTVGGRIVIADVVATAAHIHAGAAGTNGPVVVTLTKSSSTTFTVPNGSKLSEAHYAAYRAGNLYVNVHSAKFPGGEIRAQIKPVQ